ncbi:hypothetical protein GF389_00660 [Candidatus Dojkabacteria bacterium]|nr:hypothetical protein [Candidatus Dojkabacteria bacterium]
MIAVFGVRLVKDYIIGVSYYSYQSVLIDSIIAFLIAINVEAFLKSINNRLGKIIKPEVFLLAGLVEEINKNIGADIEFETALGKVVKILKEHFYNSQVFLFIGGTDDADNGRFRIVPDQVSGRSDLLMDISKDLGRISIEEIVLLQKQDVHLTDFEKSLKARGVSIAAKITSNISIIFTEKETKQAYTQSEIDTIIEIIGELRQVFSILEINDQVRNFNATLQQKIDKATQELQVKNQQLEDTLRKERDMMDILGHELRTPLTIGKNAMKYLKRDFKEDGEVKPEIMHKYLEMADENLSREASLLETLLSTTKIDNKAVDLHFEKVDLIDAVNDSLDAHIEKADEKGLKIRFDPPAEAFIYADRNRTQEIVDNLIDNAIKYTKNGGVTIEVNPETAESNQTTLKVIDTGIGIPKKDLDKLGQKFYRINTYLDSSKESDYKVVRPGGTGLGLYVTFNLIEMMNGTVGVESQVGKGSVFTVTLPTYSGQTETDNGKSRGKTVYEQFEAMKKEREKRQSIENKSNAPDTTDTTGTSSKLNNQSNSQDKSLGSIPDSDAGTKSDTSIEEDSGLVKLD